MSVYDFFDILKESEAPASIGSLFKHLTAVTDDLKSIRFWLKKSKQDAVVIEKESNIEDSLLPKKIEKIMKMVDSLEDELNTIKDFVQKSVK